MGLHLVSVGYHRVDALPPTTTFTEQPMNPPRAVLAALAACVPLPGCEIPTDVPIVEQRWLIPVEETTLGVDELLPDGVAVSGNDFDVSVDPVSTSETLGALCGIACTWSTPGGPGPGLQRFFHFV